MDQSVLVAVAGLGGAVGSTFAAGLSLPTVDQDGLGLATESPLIRALDCELPPISSFRIDGWDLRTENLLSVCRRHGICPSEALAKGKENLLAIVPRKGVTSEAFPVGMWIRREAEYLRTRMELEAISHLIIVNLCPTEPCTAQLAVTDTDWTKLDRLGIGLPLPVSAIYFRLAIEAGAHFINFTPNVAETPALRELAEEAELIYAGRDGKTGQTFVKTILAPAFRDKNLHIDGWFSTNLLGNDDGLSLGQSDAGKAKIASKSKYLPS